MAGIITNIFITQINEKKYIQVFLGEFKFITILLNFCFLKMIFHKYSEVFIYLRLHWVLIAACGLFSSCGEQGLLSSCGMQASLCGGFSCCGAQALGMQTSVVVVHGHRCPAACGIFPDQGSNPVSPALAGGFFITGPPGKSTVLFHMTGT